MKNNLINTNNYPLIILGAGAHAKVLIDILKICGRKILGVTDSNKKIGEIFNGVKVLGNDEIVLKYSVNEVELVNSLAGLDKKKLRLELTKSLENKGYVFSKVIHPSAIIAEHVTINKGVQIMAGAVIQSSVIIGNSCIVNTGAIIDHDCVINENCHIAPGVTLNGGVVIGERTHVGTGTLVIENKKIGKDCLIAAGSIVFNDIPANTKFIQTRNEKKQVIV